MRFLSRENHNEFCKSLRWEVNFYLRNCPCNPSFINLLTKPYKRKCAIDVAFAISARGKMILTRYRKSYSNLWREVATEYEKQKQILNSINLPIYFVYNTQKEIMGFPLLSDYMWKLFILWIKETYSQELIQTWQCNWDLVSWIAFFSWLETILLCYFFQNKKVALCLSNVHFYSFDSSSECHIYILAW